MAMPTGPGELSEAKRRLAELVKRAGPLAASEIASRLRLTDVAVRQHLVAMEAHGLVSAETAPAAGRGRPSRRWRLTPLADGLFPDRHVDLALDLLDATRAALGEAGVRRIVDARARQQLESYRAELPPPGSSLRRRVEALAERRSAEGYMAEVRTERPGAYLLLEHHCPICAAATRCSGLCAAELELFRAYLGDQVTVERVEHLLSDGMRCAYRISGRRGSGA